MTTRLTPRYANRLKTGTFSPQRGWNGYVIRASIACWRAVCRCFEQRLNQTNVRAALQQMGREAVAKRMQRQRLAQPRCFRRVLEQPPELARGHRQSQTIVATGK